MRRKITSTHIHRLVSNYQGDERGKRGQVPAFKPYLPADPGRRKRLLEALEKIRNSRQ